MARIARQPVTTSRFYPELERFVRYHADPFSPPSGGALSTPAPHPTRVGEARASEPETGPTITAVLELGVDGIVTDHPRLLRDVFAARGVLQSHDEFACLQLDSELRIAAGSPDCPFGREAAAKLARALHATDVGPTRCG